MRKGTLDLIWFMQDYTLALQLNHLGARDDVSRSRFTRTQLGGYTTASASVRRVLSQTSSVFLRLSNMLDKSYEPVEGYRGESWMAHLGFEYRVQP